jgi:hypothetical protein
MAESQDGAKAPLRYGSGLIGWLVSGNWPAKVGGALLIVGIGALIRYALLHVEIPPESKLLSGGALSVALFIAAHWVRTRFHKRAIAIALAGAAFGTAYLTAYSAYAFFEYVNSSIGLSLLVAVSLAAGAYAVIRHSQSLTLLSMFGAFLAPAFALSQPSAGVVYGYYLALSQLSLIVVAIRGWRALIHLSFLFTLGGGVFFAWTTGFYSPEHFATMQPLLLALAAVHVAMPLVEQRAPLSQWMARFDLTYFITLPIVGAGLFALIAPTVNARATSWLWLGAIWLAAALAMQLLKLRGVARHLLVGVSLIGLGLFVKSPELPWFLIAQGVAVVTLLSGQKLRWARTQQDMAILFVLAFTGLFVADTLREHAVGLPFANRVVIQQLTSCVLLSIAWRVARRMQNPLAPFVGWLAFIGFANTIAAEFTRWQFASWPVILHIVCVLVALAMWSIAARREVAKSWIALLSVSIAFTAAWAAKDVNVIVATAMIVVAPLALVALSLRSNAHETDYANGNRLLAMMLSPVVAWLWSRPLGAEILATDQFSLVFAVATAMLSLACTHWAKQRAEGWIESAEQLFAVAIGAVLYFFTLFHIERGV